MQGVLFNSGPDFFSQVLKFLPTKLTNDSRFLSKLITSSVISSLYDDYDILTSLGQNKEICLWISPSVIVADKEIDYFFESLESLLDKGIINCLLKFVKKQVF